MKNTLRFTTIFLLLLFVSTLTKAATKTSTATGGSWTSGSTWVGGVVPLSTDQVVIATTGTSTVTLNGTTSCSSLTVNSGSTLVIGRQSLTVSGAVVNNGKITLTRGRITQSGTANFTNSGILTFTGSGRLYFTGDFTNTGTLTLASASVYFTGTNSSANTVAGFTTTGSVIFQRTSGSVTFTGNVKGGALTVSGNGATLNLGSGLTHSFSGSITLSAGTFNGGSSILNANLLGSSTWINNGGTFTAGTGTVNLSGPGNQTITGTLTTTFNNLTLSVSGLKTLTKLPIVNGILSMEGTATISVAPTFGAASTIQYKGTTSRTVGVEFPTNFSGTGGLIVDQGTGRIVTLNANKTSFSGNLYIKSGTFDLSTYTVNRISAGGTLTVASGAVLKIGGTNTLPSNYSTHSINCTSTIEYSGSSQTVANLNSSQAYGNLILSGTGTKTLQTGTTNICNNFSMSGSASATAVVGLTIGGNVNFQPVSAFVAGSFTHNVGGDWTQNGTFISTGSTINFNGSNPGNIGVSNFNNITFSGTGVKTATGVLTISGNVTISNNFDAGSFVHTVAGNWTNNGTFNPSTSTIRLIGTTTQTIGGVSSIFNNLTINNVAGGSAALGVASFVSGTLTLESGVISLGTYDLTVENITGGSAASYVKTNSTGVLIRSITSGTAVTFPVGNAAYNPLTITNTTTGNTDNYNVRVIDGALSNANDNTKTVNRKWQITEDVPGGSALTVEASYNAGETGVSFNAASTPTFSYFDGATWIAPIAATVSGSNPYTFTSASGDFSSDDLTNTSGYLCLGSGDAFNASKFVITSINPESPFVNQNNVSIIVQSQNSNNVPTNVTQNTLFSLSAANTILSGSPTGSISANTYETTLSGLMFTTTSTTATVTATQTSGDNLSAGTSAVFSVVIGNIYKPSVSGNWSTVQWQVSTDGGAIYTNTSLPVNNIFSSSDVILIPAGITLTADVTGSFYNMIIEATGTLDINSSGALTLNNSGGGFDFGFQINGTLQNSGGTFTNSNTIYPIRIQGGTYIHAMNGGSIPVASWTSLSGTPSTCQITGITSSALTSGLNQNFQHFIWNNPSQAVIQNLSANLSVSATLSLINGIITTGANRVIVTATGSVSTSNGHINGNLRRYVPNAATPTLVFPIGDASNYTPVSVSFVGTTSGSGYLDASTTVIAPPTASGLDVTKYINRRWTLTNVGVSGFTSFSPTFTFVNGDKVGSPNTSALVIRKLNGTAWSTTTTGTQGANSTQCTGSTTFGSFAIGESNCTASNAVWLGATSSDWNTAGNWCGGTVPTNTVDVIIPAGTANSPIISATATCKNITIETGANLTISGANTLNVYGNWLLNGTFTCATGTVVFAGSSVQTITGITNFNNLTVNNVAGAICANNITVIGILHLQSDNPSAFIGSLDMGVNILSMGVNSTNVGLGEVTGIINRTHTFELNIPYTFGHEYSGAIFSDVSGQTLPTSISLKVMLGTAPDWTGSLGAIPTNPISRSYEVIQTGGIGTSVLMRVHYRDSEIPGGVAENKLTLWNRKKFGPIFFSKETGKSNQDVVNNFITIQDIDAAIISAVWGEFQETMGASTAQILTWTGLTSTDWNASSNWEPQIVPSADYGVLIPDSATTDFDPILPAGATCVSVLIESAGKLKTAAGASLVLTGSDAVWTTEAGAVFEPGNSTVTVASTENSASFVGSTDFYNLTIADEANLKPAANSYIGILGNLSLSASGILAAAITDNTIEFKGNGTQLIPNPNGVTLGYDELICSGSGLKIFPSQLNLVGDFTNNGTVDALTNNSTVIMNGPVAQILDGTSITTFENLTINNPAGVIAGNDITVNGILDLASANPSATQGALELVTNWNDYPGTTLTNPGVNNLVSYYLNMGATATTLGIGDVTGIVKRTTILPNKSYSFGNQYTNVQLTDGDMPDAITVTIKIGTAVPNSASAVKRLYEIVLSTPDNDTFFSTSRGAATLHYLDSELNSNTESKLVTFSYDINAEAPVIVEQGRSVFNFSNNYIGLSNVPIMYFLFKSYEPYRTIIFMNEFKEGYKIWNGSVDTDWSVPENWTPLGVPQNGNSVIVPNVLTTNNNSPILPTGNTYINTMTIESGGILVMGSDSLSIFNTLGAGWEDQNIPGNDPATSTVVFTNSLAAISGSGNFYNVDIRNESSVSLQSGTHMTIGNTFTKTATGQFFADYSDGIVEYNKAGAQTVLLPDGTPQYHSLILSGSGLKTLPTSPMSLDKDLILRGTASTSPTNALTIGNNLDIGTGTTFTAGNLTHNVGGDFINNGTFNGTASTINLNGTLAQNINGISPATFNNLVISNTSTTVTTDVDINCDGDFTNSGTLNMLLNILSISGSVNNTGTVETYVPSTTSITPLPVGKTWGGTVEYDAVYGSQTIVEGTYNNIKVSGSEGVIANSDLTVNGILNLSANPSATQGTLDMSTYILNMGALSTNIGEGDVEGIVKRTTFLANTTYTFGNQFTTMTIAAGGVMPSDIIFKTTIGSAPFYKADAILRNYDIVRTGGSGTTASYTFHYLDGELNGNTETNLVVWDYHLDNAGLVEEHGKAVQNTTDKWLGISNRSITYSATVFDNHLWTLGTTVAPQFLWQGTPSDDWDDANNWAGGIVPDLTSNVIIPDAGTTVHSPTLPATAFAKTITIESNGILNGGTGTSLTIAGGGGAWLNNGDFNPGSSTVIFTHANATMAGINNFYNVTINSGAALTPETGNIMRIEGALINNGTLRATLLTNIIEYNGADQTIINPNGLTPGYYNLILSGSGTKTLPAAALNILGNLTINAAVSATGNTIVMSGNNPQTIDGTMPTTFNNLTINNANGVTLDNDEMVSGTLDLTNGLISTSVYTITVADGGSITNASASSYVNGKLARVYSGTVSNDFPIGKDGSYRPLSLAYHYLTGTSTVTAEQFEALLPGTAPANVNLSFNRYWSISETGGSAYNYSVTLDGTDFTPAFTTKIVKTNGTTNVAYDVTTPDYTNTLDFTTGGNISLANTYSILPTCNPYIVRTITPPAIDNSSIAGQVWMNASPTSIEKIVLAPPTYIPAGSWRAMYDDDSLYVVVQVTDANPWHNSATNWDGDGIEIYIDGDNNSGLTTYSGSQYQLRFNYIGSGSTSVATGGSALSGALIAASNYIVYRTTAGYNLKVAIPWDAINTNYLTTNDGLRMEVAVNQTAQTAGTTTRLAQLASFTTSNQLASDPSLFTLVNFFEVTYPSDTIITPNTAVQLSASASVTPDNITWVSTPTGNDGTGSPITVNQTADTQYLITASFTGCSSTSRLKNVQVEIYPDTIVWTNVAGDGDWDNYANWIDYSTTLALSPLCKFTDSLTVIIPAPTNSKYLAGPVNVNGGVMYPAKKTPLVVRHDASLYMKNITLEYGASLLIAPLLGKYTNAEVELQIADRNEWILIGPNIQPYENGVTPRSMLSYDYYLSGTPQVYMNEMILSGAINELVSWSSSFANLDKVISADKGFAIKIPDQYGKWKVSGRYYYRNDPTVTDTIGRGPVGYSFRGKFLNEITTPQISTISGKFVVACNTFASNISVKNFLDTFGGQLAVWSFNDASGGTAQPGSFVTYDAGSAPLDLYIKPMQAFMYLDAGADRVITLDEDVICNVNISTKYRARVFVERKPTIEIMALNGNYASKMSVVYDKNLSSGAFNYSKDIVKLFSGYGETPDLYSYLGDKRLQRQTINGLNNIIPLGLRTGISDSIKLIITGATDFEGASLVDKQTGVIYNLTGDTTKINVDVLDGTNSDRFYIQFAPAPEIETNIKYNKEEISLSIYTEDNQHVIVSNSKNTKAIDIFIVDMAGRVTKIQPKDDNYNVIDMNSYAAGIYSISLITDKATESRKIEIR